MLGYGEVRIRVKLRLAILTLTLVSNYGSSESKLPGNQCKSM